MRTEVSLGGDRRVADPVVLQLFAIDRHADRSRREFGYVVEQLVDPGAEEADHAVRGHQDRRTGGTETFSGDRSGRVCGRIVGAVGGADGGDSAGDRSVGGGVEEYAFRDAATSPAGEIDFGGRTDAGTAATAIAAGFTTPISIPTPTGSADHTTITTDSDSAAGGTKGTNGSAGFDAESTTDPVGGVHSLGDFAAAGATTGISERNDHLCDLFDPIDRLCDSGFKFDESGRFDFGGGLVVCGRFDAGLGGGAAAEQTGVARAGKTAAGRSETGTSGRKTAASGGKGGKNISLGCCGGYGTRRRNL